MHIYQLDDKELDQKFLNRETIECKVVIPAEAVDTLKAGTKLVVQLSNRSKYMGTILQANLTDRGTMAEGCLLLQRQ